MDEPLPEFEVELKALAPRPVSPRLWDRIGHELAAAQAERPTVLESDPTAARRFKSWQWLSFSAVAAAAAVALVIAVFRSSPTETSARSPSAQIVSDKAESTEVRRSEDRVPSDAYQPVAASNVLYEMKDEGPAFDKGDRLERRVRYRYVDTYTWKNPRTNALLTWSVPRDEIRVQPAQFN